MTSLRADLETLGRLSATLRFLGADAATKRPQRTPGPVAQNPLLSVQAAEKISTDLLLGTLLPTVSERLNETGDVMANVARHYKDADDTNAGEILAVYRQATGEWTA